MQNFAKSRGIILIASINGICIKGRLQEQSRNLSCCINLKPA